MAPEMFVVTSTPGAAELREEYDLVILGAGPAGLTAAIYAARGGLSTLVLERTGLGGEAASSELIENYPGFPEGIRGMELAERMRRQAEHFGAQIAFGAPAALTLSAHPKIIRLDDGRIVRARALVIATGTSPKALGVPGEQEFKGRGISYCATCDGPIYAGKKIAIIGCGNSGLQEGLFILRFVAGATFVEYLPEMTAERVLQDRITSHDNVTCLTNHEVLAINGTGWVRSLTVRDRGSGETREITVDGVFIYAGVRPNTEFLAGQVALDPRGFILTTPRLETSVAGVFAAGDVRTTEARQVATAIADGAVAALSAERYLDALEKPAVPVT